MNKIVEQIGKINFEGNIIPANWYKHITFSSGKPNLNAIIILAEIVYWYRPTIIRDQATGEIKGYKTKFSADKLQRSYQSFADQFGISKRQAQDAIKLLRDLGLITLEFRTITMPTSGLKLTNVMFIEPVPERIEEITYNNIKEIDNSDDNLEHYNTSYDETEEVGRKIVDTTTQRNTSYDRTEEVPTTNVGGQTPERETNTESTSQTTSETILPDSVSLSSRSSDNKLVTRSKRSLWNQSVLCSDTKIDNLGTYNTPKDTVCILDNNKRDISLNKALDIEHIKPEISIKVPVIEPDISFKELDRETAIEPVNKPVVSTVVMLEDETGKILNNNLNKPINEFDVEPEMSFDVPASELDISTIESEEDAYAILVRDGFIDPSDPDDPFRDVLKNMPPHVEYTDEELEEILKKLNAKSSLNDTGSEKKSDFERSEKILNNEQNKPKKDLFKPFSFDNFFGTSDKVAPDISRVLASKKQNENSESTDDKNLNSSLNKPEENLNSAIDMPDNALLELDDMDIDDLFELDDELFKSEEHKNAMPNPDDALKASLKISLDKEPDTSLNAPEREPERNVIMPDADLIELENEPAGMDAAQTLQNDTDLQECPFVEDTNSLTSAVGKIDCDTNRYGLHLLDKARKAQEQRNIALDADNDADLMLHHFVAESAEQGFDVFKNFNDDWKMLEEAGFTVIDESYASDMETQADAQNVLEKEPENDAENAFVKMLKEAGFTVIAELEANGIEKQSNVKNVPEKQLEGSFDSSQNEFAKMLEKAGFTVIDDINDAESDVVSAISKPEKLFVDGAENLPDVEINKREKLHDIRLVDELDILPIEKVNEAMIRLDILPENQISCEPEDIADNKTGNRRDEMPVAKVGEIPNKPEKMLKYGTNKALSELEKSLKAKTVRALSRLDRPAGISHSRQNRVIQECHISSMFTSAVKKEKATGISCIDFGELELAVNAGIRKQWKTVRGSPPVKANCIEIFKNLFAMSRQKHRKMTFACEGGILK